MAAIQLPPIRITESDLGRLEKLLESQAAQNTPGIEALEAEIDRAEIVDDEAAMGAFISLGATATFLDELTNKTYEMTLVLPHEADSSNGKISILAPAGSALLGLSAGHVISWQIPGGRSLQLRVLKVAG